MTATDNSARADNAGPAPADGERSAFGRAARVLAWVLAGVLIAVAAVFTAGMVPDERLASVGIDREAVRVGGIGIAIVALLLNALAFRPPRGSSQPGGPMPRYQAERLLHVLATGIPLVALLKALGLF